MAGVAVNPRVLATVNAGRIQIVEPGLSRVPTNSSPGAMFPESKLPWSAVTVAVLRPVFVHDTPRADRNADYLGLEEAGGGDNADIGRRPRSGAVRASAATKRAMRIGAHSSIQCDGGARPNPS